MTWHGSAPVTQIRVSFPTLPHVFKPHGLYNTPETVKRAFADETVPPISPPPPHIPLAFQPFISFLVFWFSSLMEPSPVQALDTFLLSTDFGFYLSPFTSSLETSIPLLKLSQEDGSPRLFFVVPSSPFSEMVHLRQLT